MTVHSDAHTYEQFLKMSAFRFNFCAFVCFSLDYFVDVFFAFVVLDFDSSVLCQEVG